MSLTGKTSNQTIDGEWLTLKLIYRYYEPGQGLEEQQAKIYTEVSGLPADAEEIKRRFKGEKRDPLSARYVLTEDKKLIAYVQTSKWPARPGTFIISYPWALPECPLDVQEKIFDELITWLQDTIHPQVIAGEVVFGTPTTDERIAFFQRKRFVEKEHLYVYSRDFNLVDVSNWEMTNEMTSYACRLGTTVDLDQIIEVCHADNYVRDVFPSVEEAKYYLENTFLKDDHNKLILKDGQIVSVGLPYRRKLTRGKDKGLEIIGLTSATRLEHPQAWKRLLIEVAKDCLKRGWENLPLRISTLFFGYSMNAIHLAQLQETIEDFAVLYTLPD
ncbi:MAG: hypothetical protein JSW11_07285 [Candidatus Heimdallarchaeota archaeon]|nr:MAG: hypothetical protein JSW11_07285 [Candidatus Heimdallarchaeota archaeon]